MAKGKQAGIAKRNSQMDSVPQVSKGFGAAPGLAACVYVRLSLPGKWLLSHPHVSTAHTQAGQAHSQTLVVPMEYTIPMENE